MFTTSPRDSRILQFLESALPVETCSQRVNRQLQFPKSAPSESTMHPHMVRVCLKPSPKHALKQMCKCFPSVVLQLDGSRGASDALAVVGSQPEDGFVSCFAVFSEYFLVRAPLEAYGASGSVSGSASTIALESPNLSPNLKSLMHETSLSIHFLEPFSLYAPTLNLNSWLHRAATARSGRLSMIC